MTLVYQQKEKSVCIPSLTCKVLSFIYILKIIFKTNEPELWNVLFNCRTFWWRKVMAILKEKRAKSVLLKEYKIEEDNLNREKSCLGTFGKRESTSSIHTNVFMFLVWYLMTVGNVLLWVRSVFSVCSVFDIFRPQTWASIYVKQKKLQKTLIYRTFKPRKGEGTTHSIAQSIFLVLRETHFAFPVEKTTPWSINIPLVTVTGLRNFTWKLLNSLIRKKHLFLAISNWNSLQQSSLQDRSDYKKSKLCPPRF